MPAPTRTEQPPHEQAHLLVWLRIARVAAMIILLVAAGLLAYSYFFRPAPAAAPAAADTSADSGVPQNGTALDPPRELSDFALPSQNGTPLHLSDLRGKYVMVFFGYTHCPDVCPTTLSDFVLVKRAMGAASAQVQFVFISVDGERDTPAVLTRFLKAFDPTFTGLQGDDDTLRRIGKEYGLYYKKEQVAGTSEPYLVTHSSSAYLLDRQGRMRMVYGFGTPPKVIATDIGDMIARE